jgi:glycosyltransferase involved in cell wall biosynthesis
VVVSALRRAELAELLGLEASQIAVVPSGLDVVAFLRLEPTTAGMIEQLGLLAADPLMLLPARLTRRKNVELALQVAAAMAPAFTRPVLLVTGPLGPHNPANVAYLDELQRLTRRLGLAHEADEPGAAAWFLAAMNGGTLSEGVVSDLYRLADLLLFPSWEEGFGIPLLEAGLAGIPVFCADIKPLREIAHGAATFFAPDEAPGTVAALIAAELRQSGVFHLRRRVRRDYTWQGVYRRHIAPLLEGSDE